MHARNLLDKKRILIKICDFPVEVFIDNVNFALLLLRKTEPEATVTNESSSQEFVKALIHLSFCNSI
jgi:hypothetical protein